MNEVDIGPASLSLKEVLIKRVERDDKPNIRFSDYAVLKEGPRAYKAASHHVIVNQRTGEIHHDSVKIETYRNKPGSKDSEGRWLLDTGRSINLSNEQSDEIEALRTFLQVVVGDSLPESAGEYLVIPVDGGLNATAVRSLVRTVSDSQKVEVLGDLLDLVHNGNDAIPQLIEQVKRNPAAARHFAAALNVARYNEAIVELNTLIDENVPETQFQEFLNRNPWMFGSEYSELLDRRTWVRDSQKDFMLRRTVDGYLEIIEIKTTLKGDLLFRYDDSHDCYFPQAQLSKVVGQVMHYIDLVEADQHRIAHKDRERVTKIRAKVIIGRDINEDQVAALKAYNGFLNRIEVMTFDQLAKTAQQVVTYLEQELPQQADDSTLVSSDNADESFDLGFEDFDDVPF